MPGMCGDKRTMTHKVKFTHSDKSRVYIGRAKVRERKEVGRFTMDRFWKVKYTHSDTARPRANVFFTRVGREVYRHPQNYYVVLEFEGRLDKFWEAFKPSELMPVN